MPEGTFVLGELNEDQNSFMIWTGHNAEPPVVVDTVA